MQPSMKWITITPSDTDPFSFYFFWVNLIFTRLTRIKKKKKKEVTAEVECVPGGCLHGITIAIYMSRQPFVLNSYYCNTEGKKKLGLA